MSAETERESPAATATPVLEATPAPVTTEAAPSRPRRLAFGALVGVAAAALVSSVLLWQKLSTIQ